MDYKILCLALVKALNSGTLPATGVDFTQAVTQDERQNNDVRFVVDYAHPTRGNDGTATVHVSLEPSNVPTAGVTGQI